MTIYVIAEIGVNHNGNYDEAIALIDAAKKTGANACKFQLFNPKRLGRPALERLRLGHSELEDLKQYAEHIGLDFLCTPFDVKSLGWLAERGVRYMKLASGAVFNEELLYAARTCGVPLLLSTGMATLEEVRHAVGILRGAQVTLLHCTSAYPAPIEAANLRAIVTLRETFGCPVGYSDHTVCADALLAAAVLGACVIEAHITLDADQDGPDHAASYEPGALAQAIARVRHLETMLGDGVKATQPCELACRRIWA